MEENSELIRVYTGSEVTVALLQAELEKAGIGSLIRNDFASGAASGFYGDAPSVLDLYIQESDLDRSTIILQDFIEINQ